MEQLSEKLKAEWELLMLEAKRNEGALRREDVKKGQKGGGSDEERREPGKDKEGGGGMDFRSGSEGADGGDRDTEVEGGTQGDEDNDQEVDQISAEEIQIEGAESYIQRCLGLRTFLPQIISQCLAVTSKPLALGQKYIKFVLSDGDNWIFGLVDCRSGSKGRICYTTEASVIRHDDSNARDEKLRSGVLNITKLLTFWAVVPGRDLKTLFPSMPNDCNT
ncbi:hypothetical protein P691DRAFT_808162 [Macrolepiota fuliginosa MF-IS2]|uniref:Uncharacterized protein n=1 Tax=Macrolepiota fuliginosa MF-IS2 TaxID=1400762 RepID=A0A9P5X4J4_9AGAR|nr:hypothetical protein P691DRAFT_808162 [Macrolepiota fuliginosa MF-IS2]